MYNTGDRVEVFGERRVVAFTKDGKVFTASESDWLSDNGMKLNVVPSCTEHIK